MYGYHITSHQKKKHQKLCATLSDSFLSSFSFYLSIIIGWHIKKYDIILFWVPWKKESKKEMMVQSRCQRRIFFHISLGAFFYCTWSMNQQKISNQSMKRQRLKNTTTFQCKMKQIFRMQLSKIHQTKLIANKLNFPPNLSTINFECVLYVFLSFLFYSSWVALLW